MNENPLNNIPLQIERHLNIIHLYNKTTILPFKLYMTKKDIIMVETVTLAY